MKKIANITSGECLNEILKAKYHGLFIPFNEAMSVGDYSAELFSDDFLKQRAKVHNVSIESYKKTMAAFLTFLKHIHEYDKVALWFGDEPFCQSNVNIIKLALKQFNFQGDIIENVVDELSGEIIEQKTCEL